MKMNNDVFQQEQVYDEGFAWKMCQCFMANCTASTYYFKF